jgi:hypothetical protein
MQQAGSDSGSRIFENSEPDLDITLSESTIMVFNKQGFSYAAKLVVF